MKINKSELREMIKEIIYEMLSSKEKVENINENKKIKLKDLISEEIYDWQGKYDKDFKFKVGMLVKDINPECPHRNSEGEVTKVSGDKVTYVATNNGRNWEVGQELTKTTDNLTPLAEFPFAKDFTEVGDEKGDK
tara:strand:+ start:314 stop:718 length:405 start_codon:yes stop_codon:yes gene_type:complete